MIAAGVAVALLGMVAALVLDVEVPGIDVTGAGVVVAVVGLVLAGTGLVRRSRQWAWRGAVARDYDVPATSVPGGELALARPRGELAQLLPDDDHPLAAAAVRPSGSVLARVRALPRLLRAGRDGRYPDLGKRTPWLWGLSLVYLVSPFDLVPELLPLIGVADDTGVLIWLVGSVLRETGRFVTWERTGTRATVRADREQP